MANPCTFANKAAGNKNPVWALIQREVLTEKWYIMLDTVLTMAVTAAGFVFPLITRRLVDRTIPQRNVRELCLLTALMVIVPVATRAAGAVLTLVRMRISYRLQSALQVSVLRNYLESPLQDCYRISHADLLTAVGADSIGFVQGVFSIFHNLITSSLGLVLTVYLLVKVSPLMLAIAAFSSLIRFPFQRWNGNLASETTKMKQGWQSQMHGIVMESLLGACTVKVYGLEESRCARLVDALRKAFLEGLQMERRFQRISVLETFASNMIPAVIYGYGGYLVITGKSTLGSVVAALQFVQRGSDSFSGLLSIYPQFGPLSVYAERLSRVLSLPKESMVAMYDLEPIGNVSLNSVDFQYEDHQQKLLEKVTLDLRRGEVVAVIGPSGCGKTTLAYIVCSLLKPGKGSIKVNGVDLSRIPVHIYRKRLAMVTDGDYIFEGTILENVLVSKPEATMEEVWQALKLSFFDCVVSGFPNGIQERVGKGGANLSSGERQRLSLARAILRDPDLLILDEVTSNLDHDLEVALYDNLRDWLARRAVLLITHRQTTLEWATRIMRIENHTLIAEPVGRK